MRPRTWRRIIFRDTQAKTHYRSIGSGSQPVLAPAVGTPNTAGVYMFPAMQVVAGGFQPNHNAGTAFWEPPQAQNPDIGENVPLFRGDIILRGGFCRLTVGAYPENVPVRIKVWAVWAKENPDISVYTLFNNTNQQVEWDPSLLSDFSTRFGRVLYHKEAMVPIGESFEIIHRLKPQKVDKPTFTGAPAGIGFAEPAGNQLWWLLSVCPLDVNGIPNQLICVNSYNVSFSGDGQGAV